MARYRRSFLDFPGPTSQPCQQPAHLHSLPFLTPGRRWNVARVQRLGNTTHTRDAARLYLGNCRRQLGRSSIGIRRAGPAASIASTLRRALAISPLFHTRASNQMLSATGSTGRSRYRAGVPERPQPATASPKAEASARTNVRPTDVPAPISKTCKKGAVPYWILPSCWQ
jgi:hypothetical protein